MNKFILASGLIIIIIIAGVMCSDGTHHEAETDHDDTHGAHLMQQIRKYQSDIHYEELNLTNIDSAKLLAVHAELPGIGDFFIEKRTLDITSFPCSNCHNQPLASMQTNKNPNTQKSHWDIHLKHAGANIMNCTSCHAKDNMNQLTSLTGELIDLDESYKLCGQCHSTQYKDWQGGAHGKQLNGWKPPRVAKTCVSCHNPHQPAFPHRFPARLNTNQLGE